MVSTPGNTHITTPAFTLATLTTLLHAPPVTVLDKVIVESTQTDTGPDVLLASGKGSTVTILMANTAPHIFVTPYEMVAVPAAMPDTMPVLPTTAINGLEELQVPPDTLAVSAVVVPVHTAAEPDMRPAAGAVLTLKTVVTADEPQPAVTV